jgi:hypothetical protein
MTGPQILGPAKQPLLPETLTTAKNPNEFQYTGAV